MNVSTALASLHSLNEALLDCASYNREYAAPLLSRFRSELPEILASLRQPAASGGEPAEMPKCVHVERVVFRNFAETFSDVPSAFAITADGKEWRLSEGEIARALNAQPIASLPPATPPSDEQAMSGLQVARNPSP